MLESKPDPLHRESGPKTAWTRVNIAEGVPGVSTPLNWSWWDDANERMIRGAYYDLGVVAEVEVPDVDDVDARASAIFYGRPALNVDVSRAMADLQPGTSGEALERHYFGAVRPDAPSNPSRRRYPAIALKLLGQWRGVPGLLHTLYEANHAWWQAIVTPHALDSVDFARSTLDEAQRRFEEIARPHSVLALLGGVLIQQVTTVAEAAGHPELVLDALGGYDSVEFETLEALFAMKRGELTLEAFLIERGFQGPQQGEISSHPWREDPRPVESLLSSLDAEKNPLLDVAADRVRAREAAETTLCAGVGPLRRVWARWLFSEAARMLPERESGKAAMMLTLDVARACVRRIGADCAERGVLEQAEDVFYLTLDELRETAADGDARVDPQELRSRIDARRRQREDYLALELPESWVGMVAPIERAPDADVEPLSGLGVSPGVAEGRVRCVEDGAGTLDPGEILVCEATDPSYAGYFLVAAGVITDIGGAMGHGAIVAREVGIPCVVNTRHATRSLTTGDLVRIDGTTGEIEILEESGGDATEGEPT